MTAGDYPKVAGSPWYSAEYNMLWNVRQAAVTTMLNASKTTGYVYWGAGTIVLNSTSYTISVGNSAADWRSKYVIATCSGSAATISSVALASLASLCGSLIVPLAFIDANGVVHHYFDGTKPQETQAWIGAQAVTTLGSYTVTFTIPAGTLQDGDVVEIAAHATESTSTGGNSTLSYILNDGSDRSVAVTVGGTEEYFATALMGNGFQHMAKTTGTASFTNGTTAISMAAVTAIKVTLASATNQTIYLFDADVIIHRK